MICLNCIHRIGQKYNFGDLNHRGEPVLREVIHCDLLAKTVEKLIECNRWEEDI